MSLINSIIKYTRDDDAYSDQLSIAICRSPNILWNIWKWEVGIIVLFVSINLYELIHQNCGVWQKLWDTVKNGTLYVSL